MRHKYLSIKTKSSLIDFQRFLLIQRLKEQAKLIFCGLKPCILYINSNLVLIYSHNKITSYALYKSFILLRFLI